jgi:signal transduction histidine kinase
MAMLKPSVPDNVRCREEMPEMGCEVLGVRHQLLQVVVNVLNNGIHALMGKGGSLTVEVTEVLLDEVEAEAEGLPSPGPCVRLSVRDTGVGMPPEILDRIFDPFFTTKELEEGTGLGLFLVRETVQAHGGGVRVESEEGWGTHVQIFLPEAGLPLSPGSFPDDTGS